MQRRHSVRHLFWRGVVAAVADAAMVTGLYPVVPHAAVVATRWRRDGQRDPRLRSLGREWAMAMAASLARPMGFARLPGHDARGPRPIIVVHGYAMNRANFWPLAARLARAGLGPIYGYEYWTLGRTSAAARSLARFIDEVRAATGASTVDLIGHSMGGVVGRYYVTFGGGDEAVSHLITLGSPHHGTEASAVGIGSATRELLFGSAMLTRLAAAAWPSQTRLTVIWSRADALVPEARHARVEGADEIVYDDLGHLSLLASRRVAADVIARLRPGS